VPVVFDASARDGWIAQRVALLAGGSQPRTISATALRRAGSAAVVAPGVPGSTGEEPTDGGDAGSIPAWRHGRAATAFGRAVHAVLQDVDLVDGADVESLAVAAAQVEGLAERADEVSEAVRSILRAPIVREAAAEESFREMYVAAPVGERMIEGYIDLLLRTTAGLVIVDYKTDGIENDAALDARIDEYKLQLAAYAFALEATVGAPVVAGVLVFARVGDPIERRIEGTELGMAEIEPLLRAIATA
jgi:ATP-dependent helicase/nuclease subunit A